MHKKRQARTRPARQGAKGRPYRYKGLTRAAAKERAIKGWRTKRLRYQYASRRHRFFAEPFDPGKAFDEIKEIEGSVDPERMGQTVGGKKKAHGHPGEGRIVGSLSDLQKEAEAYHKLESLTDVETRRALQVTEAELKKMHPDERQRFEDFLDAYHEFSERQELADKAAQGDRGAQASLDARTSSRESWKDATMVRPEGYSEAGPLFRSRSPKPSQDVRRGETSGSPRKAKEQILSELVQSMNFAEKEVVGTLPDDDKDLMSEMFKKDLSLIAAGIAQSQYGKTEADRLIGRQAADRAQGRIQAQVSREADKRAAERPRLSPDYKDGRSATEKAADIPGPKKVVPKKERVDPRLDSVETVEDFYAGHQGIKGHIEAEKIAARNKVRAIRGGYFTRFGGGASGKTSFGTADWGIIPNRRWRYTLRRKPDEQAVLSSPTVGRRGYYYKRGELPIGSGETYTKDIDPWDTATKFHYGTRDIAGHLRPGEWDEVIDVLPVTHPQAPRRFTSRTNVELGERAIVHHKDDDRTVAQHIVIESGQITKPTSTRLKGMSDENYNEYLVWADLGDKRPGWKSGPAKEGEPNYDVFGSRARPTDDVVASGSRSGRQFSVPKEDYDLHEGRKEIKRIPKDIKITYVPRGTAGFGLKEGERDYLMVRTPEVVSRNYLRDPLNIYGIVHGSEAKSTLVGEHALFRSISEDSDGKVATALRYGVFEPERVSRRLRREKDIDEFLAADPRHIDPGLVARMKNDPVLRKQAEIRLADQHGEGDRNKAKVAVEGILASAATSSLYKAQGEVAVAAKQGINDAVKRALPFGFGERYNVNVFSEMARTSVAEKTGAQGDYLRLLGNAIIHPFTSMSGEVRPGGIRPRKIYGRKSFLPPSKVLARELELQTADLEHIIRTERMVLDNAARPGIRGWAARRNMENTMRWVEEQSGKDGGVFKRNFDLASETLAADRHTPYSYWAPESGIKRIVSHPTPEVYSAAAAAKSKTQALEKVHLDLQKRLDGHVMSEAPVFPRIGRWKTGNLTPGEKHLLIGGAIAGTALGAGYLYNRHVNKKRKEEGKEPIAYYNRLLPPTFKSPVPTPSWQTTSRVSIPKTELNDFLQISGNKIITGGQVHFNRPTISLRPSEKKNELGETYAAGLPLGLPRFSNRVKGDESNLSGIFTVNVERSGRQKRTFQKQGNTLSVRGKNLPIFVELGGLERSAHKAKNPRKLTDDDREKIIAAFAVTDREKAAQTERGRATLREEARVKEFYSRGKTDKIVELFDDPKYVRLAKAKNSKVNTDPGKILQRAQGRTGVLHLKDKATGKKYVVTSKAINDPDYDERAHKLMQITRLLDSPVPLTDDRRTELSNQAEKLKKDIGIPYTVVTDAITHFDSEGNPLILDRHGNSYQREIVPKINMGAPDPTFQGSQRDLPRRAGRPYAMMSISDQNMAMLHGEDWIRVREPGEKVKAQSRDPRDHKMARSAVSAALRGKPGAEELSDEAIRETADLMIRGAEDAIAFERGASMGSRHLYDVEDTDKQGPVIGTFNEGRKKTRPATAPKKLGKGHVTSKKKAHVSTRIKPEKSPTWEKDPESVDWIKKMEKSPKVKQRKSRKKKK